MKKTGTPELLAPAGSFEALVAAVRAGADAVYVGGKSFGARAFAKNFDIDELSRAVVYAHLHGVKVYVAVNTLVLDKEMDELLEYVSALRRISPDALIVADLGVVKLMRTLAPEIELHASTQMFINNSLGADLAYEMGCKRVVLARELSIENIRKSVENTKAEVEIFLHGALCVSASGQCLMSSLVGGRSGNRGECAQPCRLPYNSAYPLSLKDLSLANHITELLDLGVASLKIEGRMKSSEYVYTVTSIYRRLLDEKRNATDEEMKILEKAFSRDGFTDGYFVGNPFSKMTGVRSETAKAETRLLAEHDFSPEKIKIKAFARFSLGKPSELSLFMGEKEVTAFGLAPEKALKAPLTESDLKARLSKMGNTFFTLSEEDVQIQLDEEINLSPGAVNALRREAVSLLEGGGKSEFEPLKLPSIQRKPTKKLNTCLFFDGKTLKDVVKQAPSELSGFDIIFEPLMTENGFSEMTSGVYIPPIIHESEIDEIKEALKAAREKGIKYSLVGNLSHIPLSKEAGLIPIGDFRLNVTNSFSRAAYREFGVSELVLSPEISLPMARDIGGGEIVLGKIPLMLTERCFTKENFGCASCGKCSFSDRTGAKFPFMREWWHRNIVLNSLTTYMGDKKRELAMADVKHFHFIFTIESASEVVSLLKSFRSSIPLPSVMRIGSRGV